MKRLRSIMASILAIVMTLTMGATAFAAGDTHTITLNSNDTHTYKVFQVLTGTLSEEGSKELGDPEWGADALDPTADVNAFIASITASGLTAEQISEMVAAQVDTTKAGRGTVDKDHPISDLPTGYYVMVDVTELTGEHRLDTRAFHVVEVLNDINNMSIKWETTSDEKIIVSDTLGVDSTGNAVNGKTDDVSIGDTVNYQITASIPQKANLYNYFYFIINDTLDAGLTLTKGSIEVYKDSVAGTNKLTVGTDYTLKLAPNADDKTFEVGLLNAKSLNGHNIIVTYSAVLNENAAIGENPNNNTSTVTYSNNPYHNYDGDNYPGFPKDEDLTAIGETPESITKTYTTGIELQKVDGEGNHLTGATFKLHGTSLQKVVTEEYKFEEDPDGSYYKLKDGTYTTTVPTTDDYMELTDGATEGYVIDESYDDTDKVVIGGITYRPYAPATDSGADVYVLYHGNGHLYDSTTTKYAKTNQKDVTVKDADSNYDVELAVDADGKVKFVGLGAGEYTITETVTPAGYNTISDIHFTVRFDIDEDGDPVWSVTPSNAGIAYDANNGTFKADIENKKGTELPSTGGIGTTIFYIVGGIMVAGAVVFLLTKRRIASNE